MSGEEAQISLPLNPAWELPTPEFANALGQVADHLVDWSDASFGMPAIWGSFLDHN